METAEKDYKYSPDLPQVRVLGRTTGKDVINLFWTGSGIEFLYTGSELWLEVNADYDTMEPMAGGRTEWCRDQPLSG